MSTITKLNSGNDKKIEKLLEQNLIKYDNSSDEMQRFRYKLVIDEIYAFERTYAAKVCKDFDKSMGFIYFIENYRNHERCLDFFAKRYIDEILYFIEDAEGVIHDNYNSFSEYESDRPKGFLIDIISKYDEDLSKFIKVNINEVKPIDNFIDIVRQNWRGYEIDKNDCNKLISKLDLYYDEHGRRSNCTKTEILIYLFSRNDMIDDFKKFYVMEDTSEEELNELIEKNDIFKENLDIRDIKLISGMDKIIKENINNKGKRLKF